ncbi:type III pantothenate kinase [Desertivirga arenae]|uniref:type III pantothenate kinase n=1 Tax=Desertivirga arenae TaxID=2810309 RepID=UPI001A960E9E|nr:type III pantothenate kinase [Pedobacter sp. SYSU D00823]
MHNLIIDIGNSSAKLGLFYNRSIVKTYSFRELGPQQIEEFLEGEKINSSILSTVKAGVENIEAYLSHISRYIRFSTEIEMPVKVHYKTPNTLGLDRLAAVIGANSLYRNKNCLVIDSGTCITYDLVDSDGNYYGGSISPGINMRYKAMNSFTGKLPLVEFNPRFSEKNGSDTKTSMISGVQNGVVYEAYGFIESYSRQYSDIIILLCGGDFNFFDTQLKNSIFAQNVKTVPDLVLIGLNEVIKLRND